MIPFSPSINKLGERENAGENIEQEVNKLREEFRYYCAHIYPEAARRQGYRQVTVQSVTTPEDSHEPLPQSNPEVEELEEEEEESEQEEEEEEEWSDSESEAPLQYRGPLTDEQLKALHADYDDTITPEMVESEEAVRSYLRDLIRRTGVTTLEEFNTLDKETLLSKEEDCNESAIVEVIDLKDFLRFNSQINLIL